MPWVDSNTINLKQSSEHEPVLYKFLSLNFNTYTCNKWNYKLLLINVSCFKDNKPQDKTHINEICKQGFILKDNLSISLTRNINF